MAIYTSYFGNYRNFPANCVAISITQFPPKGWKGLELKSLAPSVEKLMEFKYKEIDEFMFSQHFLNQLRKDWNFKARIITLLKHLDQEYGNVILCCYERPNEFCHRHIVADWLDLDIKELGEN